MVGTEFDTATTALMGKMITHAENECDKYISKRYDVSAYVALTLTSIPPLLTSLTETLAEGYYFMRNSRGGGKDSVAYGQALIKQAQENLKLISDRKLDLLDTAGDPVDEFANASFRLVSTTNNYTPTFNEDDELEWKIDQDKLDAIDSERQ
jgi:hypothetical protein